MSFPCSPLSQNKRHTETTPKFETRKYEFVAIIFTRRRFGGERMSRLWSNRWIYTDYSPIFHFTPSSFRMQFMQMCVHLACHNLHGQVKHGNHFRSNLGFRFKTLREVAASASERHSPQLIHRNKLNNDPAAPSSPAKNAPKINMHISEYIVLH